MWTVPRIWPNETAFIIAGGTSVTQQNVSKLVGRHVVCVNSSYEVAPFADFLYFSDPRWWNMHGFRAGFRDFKGKKVTCAASSTVPHVLKLRRIIPNTVLTAGPLGPGLSMDASAVVSQKTSLQGAINMVFHTGANRIVLLGADMGRAADGRTHHHSPHAWKNKPGNLTWDIQMTQLELIVEPLKKFGVEVLNASPISRIPWWPKVELAAVL